VIYFVDEDCVAYWAWIAELKLRDFEVKPLRSADQAFDLLWNVSADGVELVIIDVMLAVDDVSREQFSREATDNYLESGLRLLEHLSHQNETVFPHRALLLTNTISQSTLSAARKVGAEYGVELWDKRQIMSPMVFGDRVVEAISRIQKAGQ
jgi:hypothetical protein